MYIIKNAFRCISRSKGRNVLIGIIAIARALSYDPDIILADEPTGNLDGDTQREIMEIFRELANKGKCVILVSHSPEVAELCDEKYELTRIKGKKSK